MPKRGGDPEPHAGQAEGPRQRRRRHHQHLDTTPDLREAARNGDTATLQQGLAMMLPQGNPTTTTTTATITPLLHLACAEGHADCAAILLRHGADACGADGRAFLPLHTAARHGHAACVELLLRHGHPADAVKGPSRAADSRKRHTPLSLACEAGAAACAALLLSAGASPDTEMHGSGEGDDELALLSPLALAARAGSPGTLHLLLQHGADPLAFASGPSPLLEAVRAGCLGSAAALLQAGACPSTGEAEGWTPLHEAAACGSAQLAVLLLQWGADPSAYDSCGDTVLHAALQHSACVELVAQSSGIDPDLQAGHGHTAVFRAARGGHPEALAALLRCGASPWVEDDYDCSPLDVALQRGRLECVHLLQEAAEAGGVRG